MGFEDGVVRYLPSGEGLFNDVITRKPTARTVINAITDHNARVFPCPDAITLILFSWKNINEQQTGVYESVPEQPAAVQPHRVINKPFLIHSPR